jgi:[ribosomal protein S18]-alanine N-acetyltransferase
MRRFTEARPSAEAIEVDLITPESSPEDLAAVEAIARECFSDGGFSAAEELSRPWARLWAARTAAGAPLAGFLISWHVADELHVLNIATVPSLRRRGIARALMEAGIRYSSESKIRIVLLEVRRSNRAAIKLYRGLAFTALGVRPGYYADNGEDAIEMILALDPESGRVLPGRDEIRIDG